MGSLKAIGGVAVMVLVGILCLKLIPPYFSNYQFEDSIKNEALQSSYGTRSEEDIREAIIKEARQYDIQLTSKQVHVTRTGTSGTGTLTIEAQYSVPVSLPGYSTTLEFHPSSSNKGIY
jgi:transglutaminase/protease-like cytokinesis protein 3